MSNEEKILSLLEKMNDRMSSMEGIMSNMEDRMSGMENQMSNMEGRMSGVENQMSNMEGRMSGVEDRMSNTDAKLSSLENEESALKEGQIRIEKKLDEVYEQAIVLTEFRTETKENFEKLEETSRSVFEMYGYHESEIVKLKRKIG